MTAQMSVFAVEVTEGKQNQPHQALQGEQGNV